MANRRTTLLTTSLNGLAAATVALLLVTCAACDQHHSVTKQMGWQCTGITDTGNQQFPHVEGVKLWFLENPHYEQRISGPSVCADLKRFGRPDVTVTFDVWGNRVQGLHGYNIIRVTAGPASLKLYNDESGGFHGDPAYGDFDSRADQKKHPEVYRFPIDVFK